jgi:hypothetical protein
VGDDADAPVDGRREQVVGLVNGPIEVERRRVDGFAAAEGQQLLGEAGGSLAALADLCQIVEQGAAGLGI